MKVNDQYYKVVESAISYIVANQTKQPSLDDISRHVAVSKFHLQRIFLPINTDKLYLRIF